MASPNPLDSRFRGNDGQKIGGNGAIIVRFSLMSTRPSLSCHYDTIPFSIYQTHSKGERKTEWFFGYKMHSLADAVYGVPLVHVILPANKVDMNTLPTLMEMAASARDWFQPEYLMADKGYNSQANHSSCTNAERSR